MLLTRSLCPSLILDLILHFVSDHHKVYCQDVNINIGYCVIADQSCVKNSSCVDTINLGFWVANRIALPG